MDSVKNDVARNEVTAEMTSNREVWKMKAMQRRTQINCDRGRRTINDDGQTLINFLMDKYTSLIQIDFW